MKSLFGFVKKHFSLLILIGYSFCIFAVTLKMNFFRYDNFDYGKFDLGNMTQMLWSTQHGDFMYLTDYFGTYLPRWAMSHVDPIILLVLPFFLLWSHPMTLVIFQLVLVIFSSVLIFMIAKLELKSSFVALLLGVSYLMYPAIGFLTAWTGFHGVTIAIPFFLLAFYVFEKMHKENNFSKKDLIVFWLLLFITMAGKEQIPLYIFVFGVFAWLMRGKKKLGISMMIVGTLWFVTAFFVVIPKYAPLRVAGYERFAESLGLGEEMAANVAKPNYFLSRYEEFGDTYSEVIFGMITNPGLLVKVFFGGDKIDNLRETFMPVGLFPLISPMTLLIALPDFLINYLTTEGGIGTSEIYNHRVSMIVPVIFVSVIYAISTIKNSLIKLKGTREFKVTLINRYFDTGVLVFLASVIFVLNLITAFKYNNPVYLWISQAISKRVAFAKTDMDVAQDEDLEIGTVLRLTDLENKDRECALKVVNSIPDDVSVSGPDYLGAHLSQRKIYAIFPALYNEADYVIVDVFSQKILRILDADVSLVRDVVGAVIKDENYRLEGGCGNLFVFKKVGPHGKTQKLPLQELFSYNETLDLELFQSLTVVDYEIPVKTTRSKPSTFNIVYTRRDNNSLDGYFMFLTFINSSTGEVYQVADLPSFGITQLRDWVEDRYYAEEIEVVIPDYVDAGTYKMFVGMSNVVRTRSMYLGDIEVL